MSNLLTSESRTSNTFGIASSSDGSRVEIAEKRKSPSSRFHSDKLNPRLLKLLKARERQGSTLLKSFWYTLKMFNPYGWHFGLVNGL
ncbi:hypothetical protein EPI10_028302 [Gossypium australe]|uniref:Uncharacterized protein n=1 Tax=Gossypium australe TaxID=47621 RepID=A0A5B6UY98_9ROSI|nr:hypothetical protein EPI10_028302 [Gossypium australe]